MNRNMIIVDYQYLSNPIKRFETEDDVIMIGRPSGEWAVDLDLSPDTTVSRRHARISYENDNFWVQDVSSRGGTFVNGERIFAKTAITPQDRIKIGRTELYLIKIPYRTVESDDFDTQPITIDQEDRREGPERGILGDSVSASEPPESLIMVRKSVKVLETIRNRLAAFYELGSALGSAQAVEPLLKTVVEHLCRTISGGQRGAVLLLDERTLRLKAYVPEPAKPSVSLYLARKAIDKQEAFIWSYGLAGELGKLTDSIVSHGTKCAMYAPLIWHAEVLGIVYVDNYVADDAFSDDDLHLLMAMANQTAMFVKNHMLQENLTRERIVRSNLLRQFSPPVAAHLENMLKQPKRMGLGGERVEPVTILQSDVRGFTALSAQMEPGDVMEMLNQLFGVCIPIIFKYNGTVDKYIGDAILAVFGSPDPDPNGKQWENAVRAALEMQNAVHRLSIEWERRGHPIYEIGIGIHTGAVLQGFIGSEEQMEYTVIGNTVNRASRYCDGADRGEIVISPAVYNHVAGLIEAAKKTIISKHPETEPDLEAYLVKGFGTQVLKTL
ncbi:MAG: FHA domain-containing protein [Anaerolineae bacterium]|nr:FHA domain-containing protein [Anaerolineae bacterium]